MKPNYTSRSGLFLIELIISIFFFIVASAIVIQLFAKAHFISTNAIEINHSLFHTQNISEIFLGNNEAVYFKKYLQKSKKTTLFLLLFPTLEFGYKNPLSVVLNPFFKCLPEGIILRTSFCPFYL